MTPHWGYQRYSNLGEELAFGAAAKDVESSSALSELEDRLDRLTLICMSLWEILKEKGGLNEQELMNKMQQIDLADGVADGKATRTVAKCSRCGRTMSPRHRRCMYCGEAKLQQTAFDSLK